MHYKKEIQRGMMVGQNGSTGIEAFSITLSKKCERLATAIYLVTNFLSDTEPLKSRLRTLSLDSVREATAVRGGSPSAESNVLDALRMNIGEHLALLELAFISGLISEMNFTILKREYKSLRDSIDVKKASRDSHTDSILGDTFFGNSFHKEEALPAPLSRASHPPLNIEEVKKADLYTSASRTMSDRNTKGHTPVPSLKGGSSARQSSIPNPASTPNSKLDIPHSAQIESRRARILKLIKDNREVAIKDIVAHFPDISEKTIQRELVAMSDSGVLKKFGERRWSRYALA